MEERERQRDRETEREQCMRARAHTHTHTHTHTTHTHTHTIRRGVYLYIIGRENFMQVLLPPVTEGVKFYTHWEEDVLVCHQWNRRFKVSSENESTLR